MSDNPSTSTNQTSSKNVAQISLDLSELKLLQAIDSEQMKFDQDMQIDGPKRKYRKKLKQESHPTVVKRRRRSKISKIPDETGTAQHASSAPSDQPTHAETSANKPPKHIQRLLDKLGKRASAPTASTSKFLKDGEEYFSRPSLPESKPKNKRVYSYSPISRTRLTVPKQSFSPEPVVKKAMKISGWKRIKAVTINLSDLTKKILLLPCTEFSLPPTFASKNKKHLSEINTVPSMEVKQEEISSFNEDEAISRVAGLPSFSAEVAQQIVVEPTSAQSVQKKQKLKSSIHEQQPLDPESEPSTIDFPVAKAEELAKSGKIRPKKRGLIKLKIDKSRKSLLLGPKEDVEKAVEVHADTEKEMEVKSVAKRTRKSKDSIKKTSKDVMKKAPKVKEVEVKVKKRVRKSRSNKVKECDLSITEKEECQPSTSFNPPPAFLSAVDQLDDTKVEVLDSGVSGIFVIEGKRVINSGGEASKIVDTIMNEQREDMFDDEDRLHIVENDEDEDDDDGNDVSIDNEIDPIADLSKHSGEDSDNPVAMVVSDLLDKVCESLSGGLCLITEPLRRPIAVQPSEVRRVPPLKIRIPQKRTARERRPARVRDYSPPLPVSRLRSDTWDGRKHEQPVESPTKKTRRTSGGGAEDVEAISPPPKPKVRRRRRVVRDEVESVSEQLSSGSKVKTILLSPTLSSKRSSSVTVEDIGSSSSSKNVSIVTKDDQLSNADKGITEVGESAVGVENESRTRRSKVVSYEQLYPSLFVKRRRRRKPKVPVLDDKMAILEAAPLCPTEEQPKNVPEEVVEIQSPRTRRSRKVSKAKVDIAEKEKCEETDPPSADHTDSAAISVDQKDQSSTENCAPLPSDATSHPILSDESHGLGRKRSETGSSGRSTRKRSRKISSVITQSNNDIFTTTDEPSDSSRLPKRRQSIDDKTLSTKGSKLDKKHQEHNSFMIMIEYIFRGPQKLPYFKSIAQLRKMNPLAIGLKSRSMDDSSLFYREILLQGEELKKEDDYDAVIDVENVPSMDPEKDESVINPASRVAEEIDLICPRGNLTDENDADDPKRECLLTLDTLNILLEGEPCHRRNMLERVVKLIYAQYCTEISTQKVVNGSSVHYNVVVKNAHRLRDHMQIFSKERREDAKWTHHILLERLPVPVLAVYINMLRFCKSMNRQLLDILLKDRENNKEYNKMNDCIQEFITNKIVDPQTFAISKTLNKRRINRLCLIAVAPNISHPEYHSKIKAHEYMFRVLLPSITDQIEYVRLTLPVGSDLSVCEATDYCIRLVALKVVEVHKRWPERKIVLVGWGTSCVVNHQVVQSIPNVSCIIDFAFPMKTADGPRGDVDDDILLTYCPTLFVVGEQATDCDIHEIQRMASSMAVQAGVVIIGQANNNLYPSTLRLAIERFTYRTVQRALLDDIIDFLERYCRSPATRTYRLHPHKLAEVNDVDLSILRTSNLFVGGNTDAKGASLPGVARIADRKRSVDPLQGTSLLKRRRLANEFTPANAPPASGAVLPQQDENVVTPASVESLHHPFSPSVASIESSEVAVAAVNRSENGLCP